MGYTCFGFVCVRDLCGVGVCVHNGGQGHPDQYMCYVLSMHCGVLLVSSVSAVGQVYGGGGGKIVQCQLVRGSLY